jgi:hypothetical protein
MFLTGKCIYTYSDDKIKGTLLHEGKNVKMQGSGCKIQGPRLKAQDLRFTTGFLVSCRLCLVHISSLLP